MKFVTTTFSEGDYKDSGERQKAFADSINQACKVFDSEHKNECFFSTSIIEGKVFHNAISRPGKDMNNAELFQTSFLSTLESFRRSEPQLYYVIYGAMCAAVVESSVYDKQARKTLLAILDSQVESMDLRVKLMEEFKELMNEKEKQKGEEQKGKE
jgi:hypothetical protein